MDQPREEEANINVGRKNDSNSKIESSFWKVEVFLPQYDHGGCSDHSGLSVYAFLSHKSMRAKFDVGGQK